MANLDNIKDKILEAAKLEAEKIQQETEEIKHSIIDKRVSQAKSEQEKRIKRMEEELESSTERRVSSANLLSRDQILRAKQEVLERVYDLAKKRLKDMSDEDYLSYLKHALMGLDVKESQVLIVPSRYHSAVESLKINMALEARDDVEGFMIKDDKSLLNFSFEDVLEDKRQSLDHEVLELLFKKRS